MIITPIYSNGLRKLHSNTRTMRTLLTMLSLLSLRTHAQPSWSKVAEPDGSLSAYYSTRPEVKRVSTTVLTDLEPKNLQKQRRLRIPRTTTISIRSLSGYMESWRTWSTAMPTNGTGPKSFSSALNKTNSISQSLQEKLVYQEHRLLKPTMSASIT